MKKIFPLLLLFLLEFPALADPLPFTLSANADTVGTGEMFDVTLTVYGSLQRNPKLPELSGGARWVAGYSSESRSWINGQSSLSKSFRCIAPSKPGEFTIPSFKVNVSGKEYATAPLKLQVVPMAERSVGKDNSVKLSEAVWGELILPPGRTKFFAGEEIPVIVNLFLLPGSQIQPTSYPQFSGIGGAIFHDYRKVNPRAPKFAPVGNALSTIRNGRRYAKVVFRTAIRLVRPGEYRPEAEIEVQIPEQTQPAKRRRQNSFWDDDFFDDPFSAFSRTRVIPYQVKIPASGSLQIEPLPAPPAGAEDLNLIGSWNVRAAFDKTAAKQGEALTLTLHVDGTGSAELLRAPQLDFPHFRVFPPEVKKTSSGTMQNILIRYAMIPLEQGRFSLPLKLAFFQVETGKYEVKSLPLSLEVARGIVAPAAPVSFESAAKAPAEEAEKEPEIRQREDLFYQKKSAGCRIGPVFPLWKNFLPHILILVTGGIVIVLIAELRNAGERRRESDPEYLRKAQHTKELGPLLKRLKKSGGDLDDALRRDVVAFWAEGLHLPGGTTAGELAEAVADPELKQFLRDLGSQSFAPGSADPSAISPELVKKIIKALKAAAVILLVLGMPAVLQAKTADGVAQGNGFFNQGKYEKAARCYEESLQNHPDSPGILYNLGNTEFRRGNLPLAHYYLSRAHRLSPRDAEIAENDNIVSRKLLLEESGKTGTPQELAIYLRDRFRPDEHLLIAAFAFFLLCVLFALRKKFTPVVYYSVSAFPAFLLILCLYAAVSQMEGPYSPDRAMIVGNNAELRTLPNAKSGRAEDTLPGGTEGNVIDSDGDFVRFRTMQHDGWVRKDCVKKLF